MRTLHALAAVSRGRRTVGITLRIVAAATWRPAHAAGSIFAAVGWRGAARFHIAAARRRSGALHGRRRTLRGRLGVEAGRRSRLSGTRRRTILATARKIGGARSAHRTPLDGAGRRTMVVLIPPKLAGTRNVVRARRRMRAGIPVLLVRTPCMPAYKVRRRRTPANMSPRGPVKISWRPRAKPNAAANPVAVERQPRSANPRRAKPPGER